MILIIFKRVKRERESESANNPIMYQHNGTKSNEKSYTCGRNFYLRDWEGATLAPQTMKKKQFKGEGADDM